MNSERDTIFALSSGRPPAAIAVIRISGPRAGDALRALTGKIPEPRKAAFARVRDPQTSEPIDDALALWFPGPHSETGEDVAELQLHGGRAVIAAVLAALGKLDGLRPAEAGEFTRRGFENGKLDLTAVEGLADLVMAETEGQRRQALRQVRGALRERAESWRERLVRALALVEARIDFADEADVPEDLLMPALTLARELAAEIETALADDRRGERLREGLVVAIAGPPNAGKSTLLNRIARREAAIVSPYAGTTRDVIEVHLDLDGWPVTLLDTAGIRDVEDPVEREGVRRARERAAAADLVLWVVDASAATAAGPAKSGPKSGPKPQPSADISDAVRASEAFRPVAGSAPPDRSRAPERRSDRAGSPAAARPVSATAKAEAGMRTPTVGSVRSSAPLPPDISSAPGEAGARQAPGGTARPFEAFRVWLVYNKIDLVQGHASNESKIYSARRSECVSIIKGALKNFINSPLPSNSEPYVTNVESSFITSATTGEGLDLLFTALSRYAATFLDGAEPALLTRERHRRALADALADLRRAVGPELAGREDLVAEELHLAARALGRLTGRVDVEDILDVIFCDFCIGK